MPGPPRRNRPDRRLIAMSAPDPQPRPPPPSSAPSRASPSSCRSLLVRPPRPGRARRRPRSRRGRPLLNIVVHAGTLLAVLIHYRDDLLAIARGVLRPGHASKDVPDATGASGHAPSDSFNSARGTTDHAESVPTDSFRAVADSPLPAAREATDPAGHVPADSSVARGVTDPAGHVPADSRGPTASGSSATDARALFLALVIGTLPLAAALAPPVEGLVIATEHYPKAIGVCFLVTAAMLGFAEWRTRRQQRPQGGAAARCRRC